MSKIILSLALIALLAVSCNKSPEPSVQPKDAGSNESSVNSTSPNTEDSSTIQSTDFSSLNPIYKFSGKISESWKIDYVSGIQSINIYDSSKTTRSNLDKSVIFIRYFSANSFLTLNTVDILNRTETNIKGHAAVRYEIKKKPGVANFPNQPNWRNGQHKLIDIRYSTNNPSEFYVFSYNPELPPAQFEEFINSLEFYNDKSSLQYPASKPLERITKKKFGTEVSPTNSPVQPERFSGFHSGVDFEVLPGEENSPVEVTAVCGGNLISKKQVNGYGGLAVQHCEIDNQLVTVLYGHLALSSITASTQSYLAPGAFIGLLGNASSNDTSGERKHLHLGIRKGQSTDVKGYVQTKEELSNWIDLQSLII